MNILRGLSRWLLAIAVGLVLAAWVSVSVLQATLLNRDTVKGWLATSGAYDDGLKPFAIIESNQGLATSQDMQAALEQTFPANYLKTQTERAIDATFDWIEGKKTSITFSIPVQERREEFRNNLVLIVTPRLAQLPACPTRVNPNTSNPTCIPQGMSAASFADQSLQLVEGSGFLDGPLTQNTLKEVGIELPEMPYLPAAASAMRTASVVLPILAVLMGIGYVLLCDSKLKGLSVIGRRVFFQGLLITIGGGLLWFFGAKLDLSAAAQAGDAQQAAMVVNIINPLVQTVFPGVGLAFAMFGGMITAVGGATWLAGFFARRKYTKVTPFTPGPKPPAAPTQPPSPEQPPATPPSPTQPAKTIPKPQTPPRIVQ
ncbi:MAG TPA: hypothetical protein VJM32_06775 [Candidatus Saccharimonadales bacterium]|nr:hypothetical protein [Candidatus Saccharimonadales bacterium]